MEEDDWAEILAGTSIIAQAEQKALLKGREEGEQIGRAKVEQKARQLAIKTIRQTLVICFHTELEQYDNQLNQLDLPALERLSDLVFADKTLAEFEAELSKLTPS